MDGDIASFLEIHNLPIIMSNIPEPQLSETVRHRINFEMHLPFSMRCRKKHDVWGFVKDVEFRKSPQLL